MFKMTTVSWIWMIRTSTQDNANKGVLQKELPGCERDHLVLSGGYSICSESPLASAVFFFFSSLLLLMRWTTMANAMPGTGKHNRQLNSIYNIQ